MNLEIQHVTRYIYDRQVELRPHLLYLRPRAHPGMEVHQFALTLHPAAEVQWMRDDFDNLPASVRFLTSATELVISARTLVTTSDAPPFDFLVRDYARHHPFVYESLHAFNLAVYRVPPPEVAQHALRTWMGSSSEAPPRETVAWLWALNRRVKDSFRYLRREQPGIQDSMTTLRLGSGSCRDYAAFMIDCLRISGFAARFVSGYQYDSAVAEKAMSMHAWVEVFLPGAGWKGLDPTNGLLCDATYVPVAHAAVAESVNPIQGSYYSREPATACLKASVSLRQVPLA